MNLFKYNGGYLSYSNGEASTIGPVCYFDILSLYVGGIEVSVIQFQKGLPGTHQDVRFQREVGNKCSLKSKDSRR